ncbi:hypothetical protein [Haliscomenobacter hydrossis]|uniref:Uncharacterized protein n=1 Tax=Haliscomenobacter hydrossis (strain ATCC 27775 / DSM 1100 / LMG 10767 / O) TaxID=760192 RepID=F4KRH2_HALH1|nr:hypothetical protein [Haliscomenobacter hydrossis]AEE47962.1 hypothetical protein Halhy_0048 [Haliscomenobacter hydrossis DSM 1100]
MEELILPKQGVPSPALAAQIQEWINALPSEGLWNWVSRVCKEEQMLPLHSTSIYIWALRPDGQVLCMDHEAFSHPIDREIDPLKIYAVLQQGTRTYPELSMLIPPSPPGIRQCESCAGLGWVKLPEAAYADTCIRCDGFGWY